mgnify:CR=1 FL=1|tara:strand:- start:286 stop:465 length:180 start_codon:yes stop_codon:yes gene_type:complete
MKGKDEDVRRILQLTKQEIQLIKRQSEVCKIINHTKSVINERAIENGRGEENEMLMPIK